MKKFIFLLLFAGICFSCRNADNPQTTEEDPVQVPPEIEGEVPPYYTYPSEDEAPRTFLKGTELKLVGIFDVKTDTLINELEPKDCGYCFTLTFETDYVASAYGVSYEVGKLDLLKLTGVPEFGIPMVAYTQKYEKDGKDYDFTPLLKAIKYAHTFKIDSNGLYLYYNTFGFRWNTYLLFKTIDS
jgi:hypothetical protein